MKAHLENRHVLIDDAITIATEKHVCLPIWAKNLVSNAVRGIMKMT